MAYKKSNVILYNTRHDIRTDAQRWAIAALKFQRSEELLAWIKAQHVDAVEFLKRTASQPRSLTLQRKRNLANCHLLWLDKAVGEIDRRVRQPLRQGRSRWTQVRVGLLEREATKQVLHTDGVESPTAEGRL